MAEKETAARRLYTPVDICEMDDKILLWAEMPGVKKEEVEIKVEGNELEIIGHLKETEEGRLLLTEFPREGNYHRVFTISDEIDTSGVKAKLTGGVLELTLPKKEQARPREIPIEVE